MLKYVWVIGLSFTVASSVLMMLYQGIQLRSTVELPRPLSRIIRWVWPVDEPGMLSWLFFWLVATIFTAILVCLFDAFGLNFWLITIVSVFFGMYGLARYRIVKHNDKEEG